MLNLEGADRADAILQSGERLIAPDLIIPDITRAVWKSVVFASTAADEAGWALGSIGEFFDEIVPAIILKDGSLQVAIELRQPVYDCFYLALAEQRDCQMATADDRLITRCARSRYAKRIERLLGARADRLR